MHYHLIVGSELYGTAPTANVKYESLGAGVTDFIAISRQIVLSDRDQEYFDEYRAKITQGLIDNESAGWMVNNGTIKVALLACLGGCFNWCDN